MSIQKIIDSIIEYDTIIIHRHVRPDPDALGSQAGLKEIITQTFPEKSVYIVGEEDQSLNYLTRMQVIDDATYKGALAIICDTANRGRIDDSRYTLADKLIKIDHHPEVDQYGDVQWVNTSASSTCEMIYEFYLQAKSQGFHLTDEAARLIYAGIVGDTGRFLFPSTSKKTFQFAADLVTYNFDRPTLYTQMYSEKNNIAKLRGYILQNFKLSPTGVSSIKLTHDILKEYGVTALETSQLVGTFGDIEGICTWAIFVDEEDSIRVRIRSKGPAINKIAEKYNGGGHPLAAGATIYHWEDYDKVMNDLDKACRSYQVDKNH
ncbi:bifunctional oligoribonuclease/PAP phosphatase NrnA [Virgibacillus sp. MSJ-26]|uniref:DHH family phosphoesterase n=1 Tax=Virgibacillus sp. MSJ-26 TaxID=2841522 RepID=UPI001C119E16|nr:bifunctional oligoribonuclease/PAP phosphatase NrnA [Virgibacillus sp. MSJ-26]MBU5468107.1 bifunctional oligoribonuclease/PAP phosphatase NrnA [Virgibacillus sp. MSJ-26]